MQNPPKGAQIYTMSGMSGPQEIYKIWWINAGLEFINLDYN